MATIYTHIDANKNKSLLLIFVFLVIVIFLGWFFSLVLDNQAIVIGAVIVAILMSFSSYWWSDRIVLAISGAKEVKHEEDPQLYHLVENLCLTAGLPLPKIYLIQDSAPNAFATGRDPNHAVICLTTGLVEKLEKSELEGVIAHELSHIGNYDTRLMTIATVLVGIVVLMSDWFLRWGWFRGRDEEGEASQFRLLLLLIGIILAILAPLFATLMQLAISRKREYLADANAALLTRYPEGLAQALEKIAADQEPLEAANKATAHLYIVNPLKEHKGSMRGWFAQLFDTHPPIQERIKRLREM